MRKIIHPKLIEGRIRTGNFASSDHNGNNGAFVVRSPNAVDLRIIANDASDPDTENWEHVSVSTAHRTPNWIEMCLVKDLFWTEEECVIQFHPPDRPM